METVLTITKQWKKRKNAMNAKNLKLRKITFKNAKKSPLDKRESAADASQRSSRFKYLYFEILTPEEYNDVVYLGKKKKKKLKGNC